MVSLFSYFRSIRKADNVHLEQGSATMGHRRERSVVPQRVFVVSQDAKFLEAMVQEWKTGGDLPELECIRPRPEMRLPHASAAVLDGDDGVPMLSGEVALALLVCEAAVRGGEVAATDEKVLSAGGTQPPCLLRMPRYEG